MSARSFYSFLVPLVAAMTFVGVPGNAGAVHAVQLVWASTGSSELDADTAQPVEVLDVWVTADLPEIASMAFSFVFDEDGGNEMDLAPDAGGEISPVKTGLGDLVSASPGYVETRVESGPGVAGMLGTFDLAAEGFSFGDVTFKAGTINVVVNPEHAIEDGPDIVPVILDNGVDFGLADNHGTPGFTVFIGAWINGTGTAPELSSELSAPAAFDFGEVPVGTAAQLPLTLSNVGTADLAFSEYVVAPAGSFDIIQVAPSPLAPGEAGDVDLQFIATSAGPLDATLTIFSNDPSSPTVVELTGTGVAPEIDVVPIPLAFGDADVGGSAMRIVTVSNVGSAPLGVGTIDLAGDPAFSFVADPIPGGGIAPGGSIDVEVTLTPTTGDPVAAVLSIPSDDEDVLVPVSGRGVPFDEQAMEILDSLEAGLGDGSLASTQGNRDVGMRNLLETAGDFIDRGQTDQACKALADALLRVDGIEPPDAPPVPDFLEGEGAEAFAAEIEALRDNLGCEEPTSPRGGQCGLGAELALLLPLLMGLRRRGSVR